MSQIYDIRSFNLAYILFKPSLVFFLFFYLIVMTGTQSAFFPSSTEVRTTSMILHKSINFNDNSYQNEQNSGTIITLNKNIVNLGSSHINLKLTIIKLLKTSENISSDDLIKSEICLIFNKYCNDALVIAFHESGYREKAISKTGDYGVMQVNCFWEKQRQAKYNKVKDFDCNKLLDYKVNIAIAWDNFKRNGYSWRSWTTCHYLTPCY